MGTNMHFLWLSTKVNYGNSGNCISDWNSNETHLFQVVSVGLFLSASPKEGMLHHSYPYHMRRFKNEKRANFVCYFSPKSGQVNARCWRNVYCRRLFNLSSLGDVNLFSGQADWRFGAAVSWDGGISARQGALPDLLFSHPSGKKMIDAATLWNTHSRPPSPVHFADDGQLGHPQVTNCLNGFLGLSVKWRDSFYS